MRLKKLLKGVYYSGDIKNVCINKVTEVLEKVEKGSLFVAVRGIKTDGNALVFEAVRRGAVAVVCEQSAISPAVTFTGASFAVVSDARRALALISSNFYKNPSKKLSIIGITGTNGKTTTAFMLWHILSKTVGKTGLIGTVKNIYTNSEIPENTTPHAEDLHKMLAEMAKNGCRYAVMEASSQGLHQKRTEGIDFRLGVFTNFSPEHMDYHKTENEYFNSKYIICGQSQTMLVNADDAKADAFINAKFFSVNKQSDFYATNTILTKKSLIFTLHTVNEHVSVTVPCVGLFNIYNALCALSAAISLGVSPRDAAAAIATFKGVPGRQEFVEIPYPFDVMIDFAHTPKSLEQILKTLRPLTDGKLICVFGCGGDRDRQKRPLMGRIAVENSDFAVITTDNPRTEPPVGIIDEITAGIDEEYSEKYTVVPDREAAIKYALQYAGVGDTVLIAGKGHEDYQIIGTEKIPFDEKEIIKRTRL